MMSAPSRRAWRITCRISATSRCAIWKSLDVVFQGLVGDFDHFLESSGPPALRARAYRSRKSSFSDPLYPLLLRARRERPCSRSAAQQRDKLASSYVEHG